MSKKDSIFLKIVDLLNAFVNEVNAWSGKKPTTEYAIMPMLETDKMNSKLVE